MKRTLLQTFLGILSSGCGIYLVYLYILGLNNGGNLLFLLGSIILIGFGIFCLLRAGKSDSTVIKKIQNNSVETNTDSLENVLSRNNELSEEWKDTTQKRNKLQMLEIASTPVKNE